MKFGFVTCVELGLSCLEEIYACGGGVDLLLSLPDDLAKGKSGRIYLDDFSREHGVPLAKVRHINDKEVIELINAFDLDWLFVIGWSQIAGSAVLKAPKRGVVGMHPTLLPEGRGRAAVPWAIIKGLKKTGVTMFVLDEGVDTGPILGQVEIPMSEGENASSLYAKVNDAHRHLIRDVWPAMVSGAVRAVPQDDSRATEWPGRRPEDGVIDSSMSVSEVDRLVRAVTRPYPGAYWEDRGVRWRVWSGKKGLVEGAPLVLSLSDGTYSCLDSEIEST